MTDHMKRILVTGATGKVGSHFIDRILHSESHRDTTIRALLHNRLLQPHERLEEIRGSISDREVVRAAMQGITHVVHCSTCKETPDNVIDVTVKGLFWLLEECRISKSFQRIIVIGGDAALGPFFLSTSCAGDGTTETQCLSRLLRALEGSRRSHAGAIFHSIQPHGVLFESPLDHGEGRLQIFSLFRRRRLRRPTVAGPRRPPTR
jgi:hypothetical protein